MELRKTVKLRAELQDDGNKLVGLASVFDTETYIRGEGYEVIGKTAFDDVLSRDDLDTYAAFNHDPSLLLGTVAAGSLRLEVVPEGLQFEVDLPDTTAGRDVKFYLQRGDLKGCSFAWMEGDSDIQARSGGGRVKVHTRVDRLVDVSVVTLPAYPGTSAKLRSEQAGNSLRLVRAKLTLWKGQA
jgi:HK97 family phage prohead protease